VSREAAGCESEGKADEWKGKAKGAAQTAKAALNAIRLRQQAQPCASTMYNGIDADGGG